MAESTVLEGVTSLHVVGVGGAGMSALARLLSDMGLRVTGSDAVASPVLDELAAAGVETWAGHRPDRVTDADVVVASSAVPATDSELAAAAASGRDVWRRPDLLEAISAAIPTIGVTGTHGKTSATAMLLFAARGAGLDPSFVVGADVGGIDRNAGRGADDLLVLEVDEAFGTFERVHLRGLVVTNVEVDHLDHFGSHARLAEAFDRVAAGVTGPVVACIDDPGAARLASAVGAVPYGTDPAAGWRITDVELSPHSVGFAVTTPAGARHGVDVARPGLHMARNAAGVLALVGELGHDVGAAIDGLRRFRGVGRRWDHRGTVGGIEIVDDYAHHPTEVAATITTALATGRRVVAVFQPHLYSRTKEHAEAFGVALAAAPVTVVLDVYGAREEPVAGVDGFLVSAATRRAGGEQVVDAPDRSAAAGVVAGVARSGDLVVTMGAGDVTGLADELLTILQP